MLGTGEDRRPRLQRIEGGGTAFIHPCGVCGSAKAPFGFNVSIRKGKPGYWRCMEHREIGENVAVPEPKKTPKPKPESEVARINSPEQGDLF